MHRKNFNFLDCGIEEAMDPKIKFKSLISVTVSTVMCIAAKCPLPKSNVETTKLFLSTITDDNDQAPRNIKGFLTLLNNYSGPYESDSNKEKQFEKPSAEKPTKDKESKPTVDIEQESKNSSLSRENTTLTETHSVVRKIPKPGNKKTEKDSKKPNKSLGSRVSPSKMMISKS